MIDFKNYERLTQRTETGKVFVDFIASQAGRIKTIDRLAKLEDMIEQGKLVEKIEHKTSMTNREWLNNLSNEQLVEFIYGELPYIARQYAQSYTGVIQWLNEEHKE